MVPHPADKGKRWQCRSDVGYFGSGGTGWPCAVDFGRGQPFFIQPEQPVSAGEEESGHDRGPEPGQEPGRDVAWIMRTHDDARDPDGQRPKRKDDAQTWHQHGKSAEKGADGGRMTGWEALEQPVAGKRLQRIGTIVGKDFRPTAADEELIVCTSALALPIVTRKYKASRRPVRSFCTVFSAFTVRVAIKARITSVPDP